LILIRTAQNISGVAILRKKSSAICWKSNCADWTSDIRSQPPRCSLAG
jgi:hypothetical protein